MKDEGTDAATTGWSAVQLEIVHLVRLRVSGSSVYALAALALILILLMVLGLAGRL
jgi:hypothetical protein